MNKGQIFLVLFLMTCRIIFSAGDRLHLKVGVYQNAPKIYAGEDGKVSGFWAELVEYIAKEENWDIQWVEGNWEQCLQNLEKSKIDIMVDVAYTPEREKKYTFQSETTLLSWSRLYARRGTKLQTIFDLEGKKVACLRGSYNLEGTEGFTEMLRKFYIDCEIILLSDYKSVFEALDSGEVYAGITNKDFGSRYEDSYEIERTPIVFQPARLLFAFNKESDLTPYLIKVIDKHISNLKDDKNSMYYSSLDKLPGNVKKVTAFPLWIKLLILIILFIAAIFLVFIRILKYEVNQKTSELRLSISKLKIAEDNLTKYRDQLEMLVAERTEELQKVNSELEKANSSLEEASRLKSQFLANMSHELRSPLNSIIGFTGIMIQGLSGELNSEQTKQMKMVYESAHHLLGLINDILDLSKIEAGRIKIFYEELELIPLIDMVHKMIYPMAEEKGLPINKTVAENVPKTIFSDRNRIKQVLINLLSNSIKFTENGAITISCKLCETGETVEFSVIDSGIGIKEEEQKTIFEEFTQIETIKRTKPEGTGLGLAISQKLVQMMGGRMWVESRYGEGSTFSFTIPLSPDTKESNFRQESEFCRDTGKKLILTIDDEETAQEILKKYLTSAGYQVIQAYNYGDALKKASEHQPFAITLDMVMPGKDGWEILEQLKNDELTKEIPVICISTLDNRELGISLGAVEYLVKPIDSRVLMTELERLEKEFQINKILIIDDNPNDIDLLIKYLSSHRTYKILVATCGKEGLEKIKKEKPDLIILDLLMPEIDGFQVIRIFKKDPEVKDIPTIIISAKKLDAKEKLFLESNIEGYIHKGKFEKEVLLSDITHLIEKIESSK
jgi:signal transduction histidine kinase/CheY-like chemotaxis protein